MLGQGDRVGATFTVVHSALGAGMLNFPKAFANATVESSLILEVVASFLQRMAAQWRRW